MCSKESGMESRRTFIESSSRVSKAVFQRKTGGVQPEITSMPKSYASVRQLCNGKGLLVMIPHLESRVRKRSFETSLSINRSEG
jgi:hypothetical protein